uniref:Uncharacterized protein n=1 Tax=Tanacetum cinerariifolium TaxID=118510 RepID=A0A699GUZ9_TANCI|nr:hypothetical protein [Tanacetum cinerariifolium]
MARLPTYRASQDEYMGVWFRCEVANMVEVRSTAVIFHKELKERVESRRVLINHLEKVRGCPTYGWLKPLKENHVEDLEQLGIVNGLVARTYATVCKREIDVPQMDVSVTVGLEAVGVRLSGFGGWVGVGISALVISSSSFVVVVRHGRNLSNFMWRAKTNIIMYIYQKERQEIRDNSQNSLRMGEWEIGRSCKEDRASLDEYMGVWFRCEVAKTVEVHSAAFIFRKELEERVESRCVLINHLEKVRGCPTYGWLKPLKENHIEDLEQMYAAVSKRERERERVMWLRWTSKHGWGVFFWELVIEVSV